MNVFQTVLKDARDSENAQRKRRMLFERRRRSELQSLAKEADLYLDRRKNPKAPRHHGRPVRSHVTYKTAARWLNVKPSVIVEMIHRGDLRGKRRHDMWYVNREDVEKFI